MRTQHLKLHSTCLLKFQLRSFVEVEPFTIEIPEDLLYHDENLRNKLIKYSGVRHLYLRRISNKRSWFSVWNYFMIPY